MFNLHIWGTVAAHFFNGTRFPAALVDDAAGVPSECAGDEGSSVGTSSVRELHHGVVQVGLLLLNVPIILIAVTFDS